MTSVWRAMAAGMLLGCSAAQGPKLPADLAPERVVAGEVQVSRALGDIQSLISEHLLDTPLSCAGLDTRYVGTFGATGGERFCHLTHLRAMAWLAQRLSSLGLTPQQQDVDDGQWSSSNLWADLPGGTAPDHVVIVSAHYDAFWSAADDNTTGVAALLELARVLQTHPHDKTIRFLFFDLEEVGLIGSTRYVARWNASETLDGVINLDAIGYADSRAGSQQSPLGFPTVSQADFILVAANDASRAWAELVLGLNQALGLTPVTVLTAPGTAGYPLSGALLRSDHAPFWNTGKPALFFTDTANFRNAHYHTETDTFDTLNPPFYEGVLRLLAATSATLAGVSQ